MEVADLKRQLEQRARDVEAANNELQSFAYSVSHDLRAPLRTIDGFSQILVEDYAAQLDQEGQFLISRIRSGTVRMGELIEDLLKLSRLSRAAVSPELLSLTDLATDLGAELRRNAPERAVELVIAPGLEANGDRPLMRLVLQNLLENAWKYTAQREPARIEFGQLAGAEPTWFVRDNGAGFDMAHSQKLFGVFQRMHGMSEFEGNGVGLAIVQRIIHRHGGRVWAEAAEGEGATFYFTLGPRRAVPAIDRSSDQLPQGPAAQPITHIAERRLEQAG